MHRASHGLIPNQVIEVDSSTVAGFLGRVADPESAAVEPMQEAGFQSIMSTDMANSSGITNSLGVDEALTILNQHHAIIRQDL